MKTITASNNTFEEDFKEYQRLTAEKSALDKKIKALKEKFLGHLFEPELEEEESTYRYTSGNTTLQFSLVPQNRFDSKSFKEDHPKMYDKYMKSVISRIFTVIEDAE